jgi:hypothetical protein
MWFPCISTQLSALRRTVVRTLLKSLVSPESTGRYSLLAAIRNTSKSLIDVEYTKDFRCPHSQNSRGLRSGDRAGQLTGPPRPVHCSPKVWFSCCLTMRRKPVAKVKVMLRRTVSQSVSQFVLVSNAHLEPMARYFCQTDTGLLMWGALSNERTGLSFTICCWSESRGTHDHSLLSRIRESSNLEVQVPVSLRNRVPSYTARH